MCVKHCLFAQKRLVIMENTGFLKSSNDELADYIKHIPDYLVIVMVEKMWISVIRYIRQLILWGMYAR